jgi:hypothetical protein
MADGASPAAGWDSRGMRLCCRGIKYDAGMAYWEGAARQKAIHKARKIKLHIKTRGWENSTPLFRGIVKDEALVYRAQIESKVWTCFTPHRSVIEGQFAPHACASKTASLVYIIWQRTTGRLTHGCCIRIAPQKHASKMPILVTSFISYSSVWHPKKRR